MRVRCFVVASSAPTALPQPAAVAQDVAERVGAGRPPVGPVAEGLTRGIQDKIGDRDKSEVIPVIIHGDAAFSGQGVVAETFNLSGLEGYSTGGTIHIIINNQIGFTTAPDDARSTPYSTDVAKMIQAPILHVNGDDPEAAVRVAQLAVAYRQRFSRDVVIDMICHGDKKR